eukprot:TRINITY_DN39920_c0_g1_i1.p1 TRINITY_DN39920_c0_g1~~TRINITY_DN39920_c0_g1_i1.p1  ORF type:complete len:204 (-),score=16.84 TRINITY_DN39920_c0_g1_i1:208-819(-)
MAESQPDKLFYASHPVHSLESQATPFCTPSRSEIWDTPAAQDETCHEKESEAEDRMLVSLPRLATVFDTPQSLKAAIQSRDLSLQSSQPSRAFDVSHSIAQLERIRTRLPQPPEPLHTSPPPSRPPGSPQSLSLHQEAQSAPVVCQFPAPGLDIQDLAGPAGANPNPAGLAPGPKEAENQAWEEFGGHVVGGEYATQRTVQTV